MIKIWSWFWSPLYSSLSRIIWTFLRDSQSQFRLDLLQTVLGGFVLLLKLFLQFLYVYHGSREAQIGLQLQGVSIFLLNVLLVVVRSNLWTTKTLWVFWFYCLLFIKKASNNFLVFRKKLFSVSSPPGANRGLSVRWCSSWRETDPCHACHANQDDGHRGGDAEHFLIEPSLCGDWCQNSLTNVTISRPRVSSCNGCMMVMRPLPLLCRARLDLNQCVSLNPAS